MMYGSVGGMRKVELSETALGEGRVGEDGREDGKGG